MLFYGFFFFWKIIYKVISLAENLGRIHGNHKLTIYNKNIKYSLIMKDVYKTYISNTIVTTRVEGSGRRGEGYSALKRWVGVFYHCHSWNSLPCSHQQVSIIATYRLPATTISFYSTTSSAPEKKKKQAETG